MVDVGGGREYIFFLSRGGGCFGKLVTRKVKVAVGGVAKNKFNV